MQEYAAWYSGNENQLRTSTRGFWRTDEPRKLHVPIPKALSALSANLLFCGSPTLTLPNETDHSLLQTALEQTGFYSKLLQAAELASAYGGVYLRLHWDKSSSPFPMLSIVPQDAATAQYRIGRLHSIQFEDIVKCEEQTGVWYRLLQTYEGDGRILSELYRGSAADRGARIDLSALAETEWIAPEAVSGAGVMLACYVPNRLPSAEHPGGFLGASDYEGLTGLFSALDEAYTALMRDVRLGKARVIVPMEFLRRKELLLSRQDGAGPSWVFDLDEEVFTALDINPQDSGASITVVQSKVRAAELETVIDGLIRRIFTSAGYSPQSLGLGDLGAASESGVALNIRERLSMQTTEAKKTHWWHALLRIGDAIWRLTQVLHGREPAPADLTVAFPDNAQPDLSALAAALAQLSAARAISTERMVAMLNPELAEDDVRAEVARIRGA